MKPFSLGFNLLIRDMQLLLRTLGSLFCGRGGLREFLLSSFSFMLKTDSKTCI